MSNYTNQITKDIPKNVAIAAISGVPVVGGSLSVIVSVLWPSSSNSNPLLALKNELIRTFEESLVETKLGEYEDSLETAKGLFDQAADFSNKNLYDEILSVENILQTLVPGNSKLNLAESDLGIPYYTILASLHLSSLKIKTDYSGRYADVYPQAGETEQELREGIFNTNNEHYADFIHQYCSTAIKAFSWALKHRLDKITTPKLSLKGRGSTDVVQCILRWEDLLHNEKPQGIAWSGNQERFIKLCMEKNSSLKPMQSMSLLGYNSYLPKSLRTKMLAEYCFVFKHPLWTRAYIEAYERTKESLRDLLVIPAFTWMRALAPINDRAPFLKGKWYGYIGFSHKDIGISFEIDMDRWEINTVEMKLTAESNQFPGSGANYKHSQRMWVDYFDNKVQMQGMGFLFHEKGVVSDYHFVSLIDLTVKEGKHTELSGKAYSSNAKLNNIGVQLSNEVVDWRTYC